MILETILALTPIDYEHLAKTVQVEAAIGTFDEYCVAASVLNRVRSNKFPNTVAGVVYARGQYEGFSRWRPYAQQSLVNRLKSEEGTKNLLKAYEIIGDRTDFKGQSMLYYRHSEDPMCHPRGNFYHHYWQR